MTETTETAINQSIENINGLLAQSKAPEQPRAFELNKPYFDVVFPVSWAPLGEIHVTHRLRRPRFDQEATYKKKSVVKQRFHANGQITDEGVQIGQARIWLWDQISIAIKGYPGLQGDEDGWVELTLELRRQMRDAHKESAIRWLYECDAQILHDESIMSYTGGQWTVLLRLGQRDNWYASIKLRLNEWDEKQKDRFESSSSIGSSKVEGKTQQKTSAVNQIAYRTLFGGTLIDVRADDSVGLHELITCDGEEFSALNKDKFAAAFLGEWQFDVMMALTQEWAGK
jgi:hypothetical protein